MSRHLIEQATFDVSFDETETALAQEPGLPAFVRDRLMPLADEIFCAMSGEDTILQLERLEIDLGDITYDGFQGEMERRFKTMLTAALHDRKHALVAISLPGKEKDAATSAAFGQLKRFLETGHFEWSGTEETPPASDQLLREAIRGQGPALVAFLKNTPFRDVAVKRLARQFSAPLLTQLMELISIGDGIRLERLTEKFVGSRRSESSGALDAEETRAMLWGQLLSAYLGSEWNFPDPEGLFKKITENLLVQPAQRQAAISADQGQASAETGTSQSPLPGSPDASPAAPIAAAENEPYRLIVQRLQGQSGPDLSMYIVALMRAAPASVERLLRQLQSGAIRGNVDFLEATEARQLLRSFIQLRHGKPDGAFIGSIEARATQARDAAHYYRAILRQLLLEQDVDLETAAAAMPARVADDAMGSGDNRPASGADTPVSQPSHLPALLERALSEGHAGELAGVWEELRQRHADLIRAAFARHMRDESRAGRVAAGFPEKLLLQLAGLVGGLLEQEHALLEALSRHPALRREAARERNEVFWVYTLRHLQAYGARSFVLVDYLRGLLPHLLQYLSQRQSQHLPNDGAEIGPLLRALRDMDDAEDAGDLHDHLLAASWSKASHETFGQKHGTINRQATPSLLEGGAQLAASKPGADLLSGVASGGSDGRSAASANQATLPASFTRNDAPDVAQAHRRIVQALQGQSGPDLTHLIEETARSSSADLDRLFRQLQSGEIQGDAAFLSVAEVRQLLRAFIQVRHGAPDGPFARSIEAQAVLANDVAHYYRVILRQLLREQEVDLEAAAAAPIQAGGDSLQAGDDRRASNSDAPRSSVGGITHFPALLDRVLQEGNARELTGMWEALRYHHTGLLRAAFARHMGDDGRVARVAAGFPETLLLELAAVAGDLAAAERTLLEALSRHPALRREAAQENNVDYWVHTLRHIHTRGERRFDLVEYIHGLTQQLSQHLSNTGSDLNSLLQALRQIKDMGALHDHLLATWAKPTHDAAADAPYKAPDKAQQGQEATSSAAGQAARTSVARPANDAAPVGGAEAYELLVKRLQGTAGPDLAEVIATAMQTAPASLERLFQQLQAGEIEGDVAFLSIAETRQLLQAFVHLRLGAKGEKLLLSIDARSKQAGDVGHHYRQMLKQLLQKKDQQAEMSARSRQQDRVPSPGAREEETYRDIVRRLRGQSGQDVGNIIEALRKTSPTSLERLLAQLRSGEIRGELKHLHAEEVRQMLFAFMDLNTASDRAPISRISHAESVRSIEAQALEAGDADRYYRHRLEQLLRGDKPKLALAVTAEDTPTTGAESSRIAQDVQTAIAGETFFDEALQQGLERRLQEHAGPSLASAIETLGRHEPGSLEGVFRQLRSGGIRGGIGYLDADEARQMIFAVARLRHGVLDADFIQRIDAQAAQENELAQYYRSVLEQLLDSDDGAFETTLAEVAGSAPDSRAGPGSKLAQEQVAKILAGVALPDREAKLQLMRRFQGQAGPSLANLIATLERSAPALLENLFQQWQSGVIEGDVVFLDAAEAQQLLQAFVRLRLGKRDGALLHSIEARAAQAPDRTHHYRALLKQFLQKRKPIREAASNPAPDQVRDQVRDQGNEADHRNAAQEVTSTGSLTDSRPGVGLRGDRAADVISPAMQQQPDAAVQAAVDESGRPRNTTAQRDREDIGTRQASPSDGNRAQEAQGPVSTDEDGHDQVPLSPITNRASDGSDVSYRYIVRRLQGYPGPDVTHMIETMTLTTRDGMASLERLFRQMQGGDLRSGTAHLNADEASGLLRAFVMLRLKANGDQFFQAVTAYAAQARDLAYYYRYLLERLLREENLDLELAAAGLTGDTQVADVNAVPNPERDETAADSIGLPTKASIQNDAARHSPTAAEVPRREVDAAHLDTLHVDTVYTALVQRLQGQAGPDLASIIETAIRTGTGNASNLERLFLQWQNGEITGDAAHLSAAEAKQLLRAFVRVNHGEEAHDLFKSIEAKAGLARDVARYYRYLLKQAIESGLDAGTAPGATEFEQAPVADMPQDSARPTAANNATAGAAQDHERMAANTKPSGDKQTGNEKETTRPAKKQTDMLIANAGLVLTAPYLQHLFKMLELTDGSKFKDERAAERAIHLTQFAVDQHCDRPEFQLVLNKILCGVATAAPIAREIRPVARETEAVDSMLQAMIQHWSIIGNTSLQGLRESFLQRAGMLQWREDGWRLKVERKTIDVLVDRLPWSFSIIKYPWMTQPIHVEWQ